MRWRSGLLTVVGPAVLTGMLLAAAAQAQRAGEPGQGQEPARAAELDTLERELGEAYEAVTAARDCTIACKALESMIRSAEGICKLEPGPRCEAARAKVDDAKRRVRRACPSCESADERQFHKPKAMEAPAPPGEGMAEPSEMDEDAASAPAPPAAESSSGCAACSLGRAMGDAAGLWLVLAMALAAARRRRRNRAG